MENSVIQNLNLFEDYDVKDLNSKINTDLNLFESIQVSESIEISAHNKLNDVFDFNLPLFDEEFELNVEPVEQELIIYKFDANELNPSEDSFIKDFKYTWKWDSNNNVFKIFNNSLNKMTKEETGKTYVYVKPDLLLKYFGDKISIKVKEVSTQFIIFVTWKECNTKCIITDNVISASKGYVTYNEEIYTFQHNVKNITNVFDFIRTKDISFLKNND